MGFILGKSCELTLPRPVLMESTGTVTIFQYGAGPNGVMRTLGKFMLGSGGMFGYVHLDIAGKVANALLIG